MDISIPSPRPKFPDHIAASAPIGMRESVRQAANLRGMTAAAFIREAIQERLSQVAGTSQCVGG